MRRRTPQMTHEPPHRVLVVGGGFGGLYAAKRCGARPSR
jgi:NADH dehydrogenase FAD-containing subunit